MRVSHDHQAGKTVQAGTLAQLRHLRRSRVRVTVGDAVTSVSCAESTGCTMSNGDGADGTDVSFTVAPEGLDAVTRALGGLSVKQLLVEPPSLEAVPTHAYDESGAR